MPEMGRGKKRSVFAFLFRFKSNGGGGGRRDEAVAREEQRYYGHQQQPWGRTTTKTKVRPSDYDDDNYYYGRQWYAERDIDRKASEFIGRVHRGILAGGSGGEQDG